MFQLTVALASGRSESISLLQSSKVGDLKILAQKSFQQGFLRLVTADGRILGDPTQSLLNEELKEECLTAVVLQAKLAATRMMDSGEGGSTFALWCCGGNTVVTWGHPDCGTDNSAVRDQLRNVQQVQGTERAFAAILADGSVVTWGNPGLLHIVASRRLKIGDFGCAQLEDEHARLAPLATLIAASLVYLSCLLVALMAFACPEACPERASKARTTWFHPPEVCCTSLRT